MTDALINEDSNRQELIDWVRMWDPEGLITAQDNAGDMAWELCVLTMEQGDQSPDYDVAKAAVEAYQEELAE